MRHTGGETKTHGTRGFEVSWTLGDGARWSLVGNLGGPAFGLPELPGREVFRLADLQRSTWSLRATIQPVAAHG